MDCPVCNARVVDRDFECGSCGEMLSTWRAFLSSGELLRQRGLMLAQQADYLGACLAFVESGLTNPLDQHSLVDASRCLVYLNRVEDSLRMLDYAQQRSTQNGARQLGVAIKQLVAEAQAKRDAAIEHAKPAPAPSTASDAQRKTSLSTEFLALELLALKSGGWFKKSVEPDALWQTVIRMERTWVGDWTVLRSWFEAAGGVEGAHPAWHYAGGLIAWQQGDLALAHREFARCTLQNPPLLNPLAWSALVTATMNQSLESSLTTWEQHYGTDHVHEAVMAVVTWLGGNSSDDAVAIRNRLSRSMSTTAAN